MNILVTRQTSSQGFTLIELMIAMAVIGIGLAIALPAMQNLTNSNRQATKINKLVRDLSYAKNEAISRGSDIVIAQLTGTAGQWQNGWNVKSGATVLRTTPAFALSNFTLIEANGLASITFKSSGRSTTAASFELCDTTSSAADRADKQLNLSIMGRTTLNAQYNC